jgi:hypothetical protein
MKRVELGHVFLAIAVFSDANERPKYRLHGAKN